MAHAEISMSHLSIINFTSDAQNFCNTKFLTLHDRIQDSVLIHLDFMMPGII